MGLSETNKKDTPQRIEGPQKGRAPESNGVPQIRRRLSPVPLLPEPQHTPRALNPGDLVTQLRAAPMAALGAPGSQGLVAAARLLHREGAQPRETAGTAWGAPALAQHGREGDPLAVTLSSSGLPRSAVRRAKRPLWRYSAATQLDPVEAPGEAPAGRGPVVVVDNYDSFTYNLCQYLGDLGCEYQVFRNDEVTVEELEGMHPRGILISPGPGAPDDSGISLETVLRLGPQIPLLGVCMGLQCMGQAYGGRIVRAPGGVRHGKTSLVFHNQADGDGLLGGLPNPFTACRYHSLVVERSTLPAELEVTAWTEDGLIMGARHKQHRHIEGVQFHPESIITQHGKQMVANFLRTIDQHDFGATRRTKELSVA